MSAPSPKTAAAVVAAVLSAAALAIGTMADHEGLVLKGYRDPVGVPTSCYGHTGPDVVVGQTETLQRCMELLAQDAVSHGLAIAPCLPDTLPPKTRAAFISAAYNIGPKAFCGSSMSRRARAGDLPGACASLSLWTKAGGRELPGLVRRRAAERAFCESGLRPGL